MPSRPTRAPRRLLDVSPADVGVGGVHLADELADDEVHVPAGDRVVEQRAVVRAQRVPVQAVHLGVVEVVPVGPPDLVKTCLHSACGSSTSSTVAVPSGLRPIFWPGATSTMAHARRCGPAASCRPPRRRRSPRRRGPSSLRAPRGPRRPSALLVRRAAARRAVVDDFPETAASRP